MLFPLLRWLVLQYEAHWPTSEAHRNRSVSRGGCLLLRLFGLSSHSCPEPLPVWRLMVYWMLCVFGRTKRGGLGLKKKKSLFVDFVDLACFPLRAGRLSWNPDVYSCSVFHLLQELMSINRCRDCDWDMIYVLLWQDTVNLSQPK